MYYYMKRRATKEYAKYTILHRDVGAQGVCVCAGVLLAEILSGGIIEGFAIEFSLHLHVFHML